MYFGEDYFGEFGVFFVFFDYGCEFGE